MFHYVYWLPQISWSAHQLQCHDCTISRFTMSHIHTHTSVFLNVYNTSLVSLYYCFNIERSSLRLDTHSVPSVSSCVLTPGASHACPFIPSQNVTDDQLQLTNHRPSWGSRGPRSGVVWPRSPSPHTAHVCSHGFVTEAAGKPTAYHISVTAGPIVKPFTASEPA